MTEMLIEGVSKSVLFMELEHNLGVLVIDSNKKKKDVILEVLIRIEGTKIEILKQHKETSNKVYSWCLSPSTKPHLEKISEEDAQANLYWTEKKVEKEVEEEHNPTMAMFLGQQDEEKDQFIDDKCIYIQYLNKKFQKYYPSLLSNADSGSFHDIWLELPHLCTELVATYLTGSLCLFTLSPTSKLSINGHLVSKDCTSMTITSSFILFTTSTQSLFHHLYAYNLSKAFPLPDVSGMPKLPTTEDNSFYVRNVERGARLVT
jgi:hypothetical protein